MSKTLRFSGLSLDLPDGWFEIKTRGTGIRSFLRFTDRKDPVQEPIAVFEVNTFPRESFTTLTFVQELAVKPRNFKRRVEFWRKGSMDYGHDTRISPSEQRRHGGRDWTCWEVAIPPHRYGLEFLSCHGCTLVGMPEDPSQMFWGFSAKGPSSLAETVRESFSFALSQTSFSI